MYNVVYYQVIGRLAIVIFYACADKRRIGRRNNNNVIIAF
jgi:hypothetical protein